MDINILNVISEKYFGIKNLKIEQYKIINSIISGQDVCGILPTGFGKSMTYYVPFLYTNKCVVVISPLIALMTDQVKMLQSVNIPVICLNSENKKKTKELANIYAGNPSIIYTTPEYLISNNFISTLAESNMLCLVAIDESHCVSNWGHNFRPDYEKLHCIKEYAPTTPILALTATATQRIQDDICKILRLKNPVIIKGNFDRPNLTISISPRSSDPVVFGEILGILQKNKSSKSLIYCKTKDDTDKLAKQLGDAGIVCASYHAGKTTIVRNSIQQDYTTDKMLCIVATIAFGLGINIPNIRTVIHYNCPSDMESYYQEIGRAGRDGLPSACYLYYSKKDFMISSFFNSEISDMAFKKYKDSELLQMQQFVYNRICRRKILLSHFDPGYNVEHCMNCDVCCNVGDAKITKFNIDDHKEDAALIFGLIDKIDKSYGATTYISILHGSKSKKISMYKHVLRDYYGKGAHRDSDWWKKFISDLVAADLLAEKMMKFGYIVLLSKKGGAWFDEYQESVVVHSSIKASNDFETAHKLLNNIIDNNS